MKTAALTLILASLLATDAAGQWTVVGPAKACADGTVPSLTPQGSPWGEPIPPGHHHQLVVKGPQSAPARLVMGISYLGAPFKGGVLGPQPSVVVPFDTAAGMVIFVFDWPTDMEPGSSVYFQAVLRDGAGVCMTETWKATSG
jgi:hypothetical protein